MTAQNHLYMHYNMLGCIVIVKRKEKTARKLEYSVYTESIAFLII